jgi:hypothetical protein
MIDSVPVQATLRGQNEAEAREELQKATGRTDSMTPEASLNRKWMLCGAAAMFLLAGCGRSDNNANQMASNTPNANSAANQTAPTQAPAQTPAPAPLQVPSQAQADAANPANAPTPPPEPPQPFEIAAGKSILVFLSSQLDSRVNKVGEEFQATLAAPIMVNDEEAIPKGATVRGVIVDAKKQGAIKGEANLAIRLNTLTVRGKDYTISTSTYAGTEKGKGKRTAIITGGGAAAGALIGGLAGGGKGAAIGAGVGGGGGLAASAGTGGQNVVFPAETRITFKLSKAITVDR